MLDVRRSSLISFYRSVLIHVCIDSSSPLEPIFNCCGSKLNDLLSLCYKPFQSLLFKPPGNIFDTLMTDLQWCIPLSVVREEKKRRRGWGRREGSHNQKGCWGILVQLPLLFQEALLVKCIITLITTKIS